MKVNLGDTVLRVCRWQRTLVQAHCVRERASGMSDRGMR
jgi:hypothetical protein